VNECEDPIKSINFIKQSGKANVTLLSIGELAKADITKLLSTKLCLPWRYTRELAGLVHSKTRGNPFFVVQFLQTIVQNKMLQFSVRHRRWMWDCDVVDLQMISEGVAELLTTTFNQLPSELMKTLKIASCLGCQVEKSTIDALDSRNEVLPFSMLNQLELAIKEGILEKAGPLYQFTHDIIQQTLYELIPAGSRILLHKTIGKNLLKCAARNSTIHILAVDQINIFCKDSSPSPEERSQFANANYLAAKFAISASSFEQGKLSLRFYFMHRIRMRPFLDS
jgi:predicted ATPase